MRVGDAPKELGCQLLPGDSAADQFCDLIGLVGSWFWWFQVDD